MAFVRFVVAERDPHSGRRSGIVQVAFDLYERGELSGTNAQAVSAIGYWLDAHLPKPAKFTRKRNDSHRKPRALSWFKDTALEHLAKFRELITILQAQGIAVETLATDRPGYVVYEDEFQVTAEPFADTGA